MAQITKGRKDRYISKGNDLIEAKRSMHLTTRERRLVAYMVSCITPYDADFKEYTFPIEDFIQFFAITDKNAAQEYHRIARGILSKPFIVENKEETFQANWLSSVAYKKKEKKFAFTFDPKLKRYLVQLKSFYTQYQMINLIHMENCYSESIYELLKQYERIGRRTIEIVDLRRMLGLEKKYPLYSNLRVKVLEPALEEVNKYSDITVSYDEKKNGRKIEALSFSIKPDNQNPYILEGLKSFDYTQPSTKTQEFINEVSLGDLSPTQDKLKQSLREEFQFPEEEAHILVVKLEPEYLEANLKVTSNRIRANREKGKETHVMSYARAAIKNNYAGYGEISSEPELVQEQQAKLKQSTIDNYLEKPYQEWFKKSLETFVLSEGKGFIKEFSQWLNARDEQFIYAPVNELLLSQGLNHPQVKMFFHAWLNETQDLKSKFSKDLFMQDESFKIENHSKDGLCLIHKGRVLKL